MPNLDNLPAAAHERVPFDPPVTPLMKWVGGKKRLLSKITAHYSGQTRIVEPFFGGGAVSFHLASANPTLEVVANEKLTPIVEIYQAVRTDADAFIEAVDEFAQPYLCHPDKDSRRAFYYDLRERYMREDVDGPEALFFMLWCAYSGLYRTGLQYPGRFNTSHGFGQEKAGFYKPENLRAAEELMKDWMFTSDDFATTLDHVDANTFVFLDPPYRETYDKYTPDGFNAEDQLRVAEFFHAAAARGAKVVYTNKDTGDDFYTTHFPDATIERVPIRYQVNRNCDTVGRPQSFEVLITNT